MISVAEAKTRIVSAFAIAGEERVPIAEAAGRVLARDAIARMSQPPDPVSSMDGYAVRAEDASKPGTRLKLVGSAPAGHPFGGKIAAGETVRLFTGSVVPQGADSIIIQEDISVETGGIVANVAAIRGRHIRMAGLDFKSGDVLAKAGKRLNPRDLALLAAADMSELPVRRRPRIAFAATGDELSKPGQARKPGGIVASSGYALSALIAQWGGEPHDLGILPDSETAIAGIAERARGADLIVTMGGASVGDHDLVQRALGPKGFALDFWKIAMRPGKPLIFGRLGAVPLLGLPGNPVSTLVCAYLFVRPAIGALLGTDSGGDLVVARLNGNLAKNDTREDYVRAALSCRDGQYEATPFAIQDSSMLTTFARSDCLIVRKPHTPALAPGAQVEVMLLA